MYIQGQRCLKDEMEYQNVFVRASGHLSYILCLNPTPTLPCVTAARYLLKLPLQLISVQNSFHRMHPNSSALNAFNDLSPTYLYSV